MGDLRGRSVERLEEQEQLFRAGGVGFVAGCHGSTCSQT
jgi:hypothetical protein